MNSVFDDVDTLISQLKVKGFKQLANILDHRLHHVSWTTGTELRDELKRVLETAKLPDDLQLKGKIQHIRERL
jgi:hypothetical protein